MQASIILFLSWFLAAAMSDSAIECYYSVPGSDQVEVKKIHKICTYSCEGMKNNLNVDVYGSAPSIFSAGWRYMKYCNAPLCNTRAKCDDFRAQQKADKNNTTSGTSIAAIILACLVMIPALWQQYQINKYFLLRNHILYIILSKLWGDYI